MLKKHPYIGKSWGIAYTKKKKNILEIVTIIIAYSTGIQQNFQLLCINANIKCFIL